MIPLRCGHCGKDLKVKDELAGKKVRCPGCQKGVAVPRLATSFNPAPSSSSLAPGMEGGEDEKTFPPKAPLDGEERTLPPSTAPRRDKRGGSMPESFAEAGGPTDLGGPKGEATQALPEEGPGGELTNFLAPPEAAGELGRLGGYRILKVLGHGGMGVVFQGEDPKLGRKVAIKAMLPHLAQSQSSHERFLREAKAAATLEHDHIVPIFHVGEDRGAPFIVMPFLQGEALDERLRRHKVLPLAEVLRIGRETAEGLAAAHERGLIHRDIKPANIWLEKRGQGSGVRDQGKGDRASSLTPDTCPLTPGRVKILDFGLARAAGDATALTQTGAIIGTPQYMAPEQAAGKKHIDHRCDLFSLGCVLYRRCTGQLPFKGEDTLAIISALALAQPREPHKVKKEVPAALSNLIMHLLAKKPEDRPQTAQEVAEALGELSAKDTAQMPAPKGGKTALLRPPRSLASRRKWVLMAAALVLLLGVAGLAIFFGSAKTDPNQKTENQTQVDEPPPTRFTNSLGMEFVLVPKGKSWLGGGGGKPGDKEIEILHDFYLGVYEVTQEEWEKVTGSNPSHFKAVSGVAREDQKRFPVETVSWEDAQAFIERLNKTVKDAGWVYRLPKEVEWEYACRGGPLKDKYESGFDFYLEKPTNTLLPEQANSGHGKGLRRPCKVGSYRPNPLGLYDMHGNVWEWCQDELKDDKGASQRVSQGGGWPGGGSCRTAGRSSDPPSSRDGALGLRLARVPEGREIVKIPAEEKKPALEAKPAPTFTNRLGMELVLVPKGKSWLGGGGGKPGTNEVEIAHDFYLGKYEVTQEEWEKVTGLNPSVFKAVQGVSKEDQKRFPVEQVSWEDCQIFIKRMNEQAKEAGWLYRLPTQVEWEYACRGGPMKDKFDSPFDFYFEKPTNTLLPEQANFGHGMGLRRPCKVGSYRPNPLGLYDMHGNVWEWCQDELKDDKGASQRVLRGGSWNDGTENCRAAVPSSHPPPSYRDIYQGLRLARVPFGKEGK